MSDLAARLTELLQQYVTPELAVFFISMLPILELRGGIIAAALLDLPWTTAIAVSILGNALPIPFILFFIRKILTLLQKTKPLRKIAAHFEKKALTKGAELIEKHPGRILVGLYLFVAIPLPMTGAWTGSLIAAFLGLPVKKSAPVIMLGVLTAGLIMLTIFYFIPGLVPYFLPG